MGLKKTEIKKENKIWLNPWEDATEKHLDKWKNVELEFKYPTMRVVSIFSSAGVRKRRGFDKNDKGELEGFTYEELDLFGIIECMTDEIVTDWRGVEKENGEREPYDSEWLKECFDGIPGLFNYALEKYRKLIDEKVSADQEEEQDFLPQSPNSSKGTSKVTSISSKRGSKGSTRKKT